MAISVFKFKTLMFTKFLIPYRYLYIVLCGKYYYSMIFQAEEIITIVVMVYSMILKFTILLNSSGKAPLGFQNLLKQGAVSDYHFKNKSAPHFCAAWLANT